MDPEEVEVKKADKRKWIIGAATVRATRTLSEQSSPFLKNNRRAGLTFGLSTFFS